MNQEESGLYSRFTNPDEDPLTENQTVESSEELPRNKNLKLIKWCLIIFGGILIATIIGLAFYYGAPLVLEKIIVPLLQWESENLSKRMEAVISFFCLSFFPCFFLPIGPSMWLIGIAFGYFYGFLLIYSGVFFGQSFPYFIGHWLFHERVQSWMRRNPHQSVLLNLAENGNFFHQFKVVALLRVSPFPFLIFNYAITATKISYLPYITASMLTMIPESFIAIYCGRVVKDLAEMHKQSHHRLTPVGIASQATGMVITIIIMIIVMVYGQKELKRLQEEEKAKAQKEIEVLDMVNGSSEMSKVRKMDKDRNEVLVRSFSWSEGIGSLEEGMLRKDVCRMLSTGGAEMKESKDRRRREMGGRVSEDGLMACLSSDEESVGMGKRRWGEETRNRWFGVDEEREREGRGRMNGETKGDLIERMFSLPPLRKKLIGNENQPLLQS